MYMDDYKRWLETPLEDPALTRELEGIQGQEDEIGGTARIGPPGRISWAI